MWLPKRDLCRSIRMVDDFNGNIKHMVKPSECKVLWLIFGVTITNFIRCFVLNACGK
jgi:hypothetical protein